MSKVICDICGTSYPDTATQCPICGCVRPAETVVVEDPAQESSTYTYVKGGRFSKSNVRKRNQTAAASAVSAPKSNADPENSEQSKAPANNKRLGLIIVLICLLLIVVSMFVYIGITIANSQKDPSQNGGNVSTDIPCTGLTLSSLDVTLTKAGEVYKLEVTAAPADTTDKLSFSENSGGKVVTVDQNGNVTCVGDGKAVITVTCGEQKKECRVTCTIEEGVDPQETDPEISVRFFSYQVELTFEKERFTLYATGDVSASELTWVSENTAVATVDNSGIVYAVSNGETDIHAKYNDKIIATCHVKCEFKDLEVDNTQEGGENAENYTFCAIIGSYSNPLGQEWDGYYGVTLGVGEKFQFGLVNNADSSKIIYLAWERVDPDDPDKSVSTSEDKLWITRTEKGSSPYCQFKATYTGTDYYLRIH